MIPPIYCPILPAINPTADDVDAEVTAWVAQTGMCHHPGQLDRIARTGSGRLTGQILPNAPKDRLTVVTKFFAWLFVFDDGHYDRVEGAPDPAHMSAVANRLIRVLETPDGTHLAASPFETSLHHIKQQLAQIAAPEQVGRWVSAIRAYLFTLVWKTAHRRAETIPGLDDYAAMRIHSGAVMTTIALLEIGDGYRVPDCERMTDTLQALTEMTALLVGWDNDLLSRHKEQQTTSDRQNLVDILAAERGCSADEAVGHAVRMRDQVLLRFLDLRERADAHVSPPTRAFLASLGQWVRANLDWSTKTARYGLTALTTDPFPPPATAEPPLPSIAWWWTQAPHPSRALPPNAPTP